MDNKELIEKLKELGLCGEAIDWVKENNYDLNQVWENCHRGDWLIWLLVKTKSLTKKEEVAVALECAKTVQHLMKDERSFDALQACYNYVDGKISKEELRDAADAAYAVAVAADTADAAYAAAYAASAASTAAGAYADVASYAAAATAASYAAAASYSVAAAERVQNQRKTADIVRIMFAVEKIKI